MGTPEKASDAAQAAEAAAASGKQETKTETSAPAQKAAEAAPALAPPEKPLTPPVMPAMTKEFNLQVSTTEDDAKPVAHVTNMDKEPDLQVPKNDWMNLHQAQIEGQDRDNDNAPPISIRLSPLPSLKAPPRKIAGVPASKAPSILDAPQPQQPSPKPVETAAARSPASPAACAAIDAYKKRQLEAIQSDRKTLMALQAAISELGLQKKLGFMAGEKSRINTPGDGSVTDATASPPSTAKP